jgi:hypothetical protein
LKRSNQNRYLIYTKAVQCFAKLRPPLAQYDKLEAMRRPWLRSLT